jgi:alpha-L-fucosidase 2
MKNWILCAIGLLLGFGQVFAAVPDRSLNLQLAAPIKTWDEAIALGNGLLGGLLWGENNVLRLSLDRGDLWDLRIPAALKESGFTYSNLQRLVAEKKQSEINRLFDAPYNHSTPTKIPAGRLEIQLPTSSRVERFELDLATAQGKAFLNGDAHVSGFFSATDPVALVRVRGVRPEQIRLLVPGTGGGETGPDSHAVASLGYPPAQHGHEGDFQWFLQRTAGSLTYCVCVGSRPVGNGVLLATTVTANTDGQDPVTLAKNRVRRALATGYDPLLKRHKNWWDDFWQQSSVDIPDLGILRQYYLVRYFYGAASRLGAPPMPLQGVWTADAGTLPPWKGDFHNDLNTQMTYMGYQGAGNFDEGRCFIDFNFDLLPAYRKFARDFYETPGANVPGVMALDGQALTGWPQYSLSPTMGPWVAHLFYLHWRYTTDQKYLRTVAYPWCSEIGHSVRALLKPNSNGTLVLPLSSSPEIHDNSLRAWLTPNSNYDLACLKMLFLSLAEMAQGLGKDQDANEWLNSAHALGDWHLGTNSALLLDTKEPLRESHRHLSNLMGLYPFNLTTIDGPSHDRAIIRASLDEWEKLGTSAWCGYSFSWMATMRARVGEPEAALRNLEIFVKAFILRNGFHANGDQTKSGFSSFTYRPFTLEGNMLAAAAVHEMLLQSWSPTPGKLGGEVIRLFPATPWRWHEVSFSDLRAEGGHKVSARRENNATTWFRVEAGSTGVIRIRDNFGGRIPEWPRKDVTKRGNNYEVTLRRGQVIEGRLSKPTLPAPPANAAQPVEIKRQRAQ